MSYFCEKPCVAVAVDDMELDEDDERKPAATTPMMVEQMTPSSTSFLMEMERNVVHVILSFLTLTDYSQLCQTSKALNTVVYESSHLFAEDCSGLFRISNSSKKNRQKHATKYSSSTPPDNDETVKLMSTCTKDHTPQNELKVLLNRFSHLKQIHLHGLAPVGDDLIRVLNDCHSAHQCTSVSLHGLALSYWCPHTLRLDQLEHLTLSGTSIRVRVSSLIVDLKRLKSLTLKHCPGIRDEDIHELGRVSNDTLQELNLNHVKIVQPSAHFPSLVKASFVGCFGLKDLSGLWTPHLKELNISFCVRLSGEQIQCLVEQLPVLETLIMMKCNGVKTLELQSTHLRRLDATFTHNLEVLRLCCPNLVALEVSRHADMESHNRTCSSISFSSIVSADTLLLQSGRSGVGPSGELAHVKFERVVPIATSTSLWCSPLDLFEFAGLSKLASLSLRHASFTVCQRRGCPDRGIAIL